MVTSDLPFTTLRRLLLDLEFIEGKTPEGHLVFKHPETDHLFIFRHYKPKDCVTIADVVMVRSQLDYLGLMDPSAFDRRLQKVSA
jgi:hypothetical protein